MSLYPLFETIKVVKDFPKDGVDFYDISSLLANDVLRKQSFDLMFNQVKHLQIDHVVGLESRGFLFGIALAERFKRGFLMIRKPNKLPGETIKVDYNYEYSSGSIEIQSGAIKKGDRVLIVDDVVATGGTLLGSIELIKKCGGEIIGISSLLELVSLNACEKIWNYNIKTYSLFQVDKNHKLMEKKPMFDLSDPNKTQIRLGSTRTVLLFHPHARLLANLIEFQYPTLFFPVEISWERFKDQSPNIDFFSDHYLIGKNVLFIGSLNDLSYFVDQMSFLIALSRQYLNSLTICFPYLKTATMEVVSREGIVATNEPLSKLLSTPLQVTRNGPPKIQIFDIHALTSRFNFTDRVLPRLLTATSLLIEHLGLNEPSRAKRIVIAFPDSGAQKRFKNCFSRFQDLRYILCNKIRVKDERIISVSEGYDYNEETISDIFLVDDLAYSGSTLHECRKQISTIYKKTPISAYVTHAAFPDDCWRNFLPGNKFEGFKYFFTTNTIPENSLKLQGIKPFHIFDISHAIVKDIETTPSSNDNTTTIQVFLASKNKDKIKAVERSLKKYKGIFDVQNFSTQSLVSEQPFGFETYIGAQNRLEELSKDVRDAYPFFTSDSNILIISIENGIFNVQPNDNKDVQDVAVVNVSLNFKESVVTCSPGVTIPRDVFNEALEEKKTVGEIFQAKYGWSNSDWHANLDAKKRNRVDLMEIAVDEALKQILATNEFTNDFLKIY